MEKIDSKDIIANQSDTQSKVNGDAQPLTIVKVGGAVVEDEARLSRLLDDFSDIGGRKVLVHGGGRSATKIAASLGIESRMVNGRRVTDERMLEVVTMVYGGLVNKRLVARLQAHDVNAVGLTGADMDVVRSHRRPPVKVNVTSDDGTSSAPTMVDFGFVGDVDVVNARELQTLIEAGITPVMAPLTHDGHGNILNTNADTIAAEVAKALAHVYEVTLIYAFEKPGVLADADDDSTVIPVIHPSDFDRLVGEKVIAGGMIPKIQNSIDAVNAGVGRVIITNASAIDGKHGTVIRI